MFTLCLFHPMLLDMENRIAHLDQWNGMKAKQLRECILDIKSQYTWADIACGGENSKPRLRQRLMNWLDTMYPERIALETTASSEPEEDGNKKMPAVLEDTQKRKSPPEELIKVPKKRAPVKDELLKACIESAAADAEGKVDSQLLSRAVAAGYSKYFVLVKVEEHLESIKDTNQADGSN